MSESDNPQGIANDDSPLSMTEAISALTASEAPREPQGQPDPQDEPEQDETLPEGEDDQNADEDEDATDEDQSEEYEDENEPFEEDYSKGRFASADAKVRLEDGTTVSVAELIAGNLKDRDYRQKTEAVAQERKAVEQAKSEAQQRAQYLQQNLEWIESLSASLRPTPPDPEMVSADPIGYMQAKADYETRMQHWNHLEALRHHEAQQQQAQAQEQRQTLIRQEAERLLGAMPELKSPDRYQKFMSNAADVMAKYGFTRDDVNQTLDHRAYLVFRDLQEYQKIKAGSAKVKDQVKDRPPVLKGGRRLSRQEQNAQARKAASDRLSKTGNFKDGVALLLMDDKGA